MRPGTSTQSRCAAAQAGGKAIANGADVAQVQAQVAQAVDLANQAKNRAIAKVHNNLTAALASATGDQAKAQKIKIEQQYGQMLADLQRQGDTAGVALVKKLINVQEARAQLQKLQREVQQILSNRSRELQSIQARRAGLISGYTARQRIVAINQKTGEQLDIIVPKYKAFTAAIGDLRSMQKLKDLQVHMASSSCTSTTLYRLLKVALKAV